MIHTLKKLSDGTYTALMIASSGPQAQQKVYYYESLILVRQAKIQKSNDHKSIFFTIVLMISPPFNGHIKNLLLLYHKVLEIFSNPTFIGSQIGFWGCSIFLF